MTRHVTKIELHSIRQTVHISFLHRTHQYMVQGLDPSASRISTLYISVGVTGLSFNILRLTFNLKLVGKATLLR
jgi:hypothetical protein